MFNSIIFTDITDPIAGGVALGAYKCAHVLRRAGYSCLVVNYLSEWKTAELQSLLDLAVGPETHLVGFSTTFLRTRPKPDPQKPTPPYSMMPPDTVFPQGRDFEDSVIAYIRSLNPAVKFVAGGANVSNQTSDTNLDYVCLGFSEISIVQLLNHIVNQTPLEYAVKNLSGITVLDDRYAQGYQFNQDTMAWTELDIVNERTLPFEISRGCIFRCRFCAFPMRGRKTLDFVKSEEILYQELQSNYDRFGIKQYFILDDTFNDHVEKLEVMERVVNRLNFQPVFWGYHRLDLICTRPHTLDLLYKIGVRAMFFGIETLDPAAARAIGKGFDRVKQIEMIRHIRTQYPDVSMHGSFIVGLPGESEESLLATADQVITQEIPLHSWEFRGLNIARLGSLTYHSDIDRDYERYGYRDTGLWTGPHLAWANEHTDSVRSQLLAQEIMTRTEQSTHLMMAGWISMRLASMQSVNPKLDFNTLVATRFTEFNFNKVEYIIKPAFIKQYKRQLIELIKRS